MKLINIFWTEYFNVMIIKCVCGTTFNKKIDRNVVQCFYCKRKELVDNIRMQELIR